MLKKTNRLTKKEFDDVFQSGKKSFSHNFLFIKKDNNSWKVSVTVSKKIYKRAVDRIKARRIIYRILKENEFTLTNKKYQAIILITKDIFNLEREKIEKEVLNLIK